MDKFELIISNITTGETIKHVKSDCIIGAVHVGNKHEGITAADANSLVISQAIELIETEIERLINYDKDIKDALVLRKIIKTAKQKIEKANSQKGEFDIDGIVEKLKSRNGGGHGF